MSGSNELQVKVTLDGTGFQAGAAAAENALKQLGDTAGTQSSQSASALDTITQSAERSATAIDAATQASRSSAGAAASTAAATVQGATASSQAIKQATSAQEAFLATLRERVETSGMNPEQLLRYRAAQLGVGEQAETLIGQLSKQGKAGEVSAAQTAAAMRMVPAQMTDIVTQLQGGASPFTVLIQQGGQMKDSFGGVGNMLKSLVGMITPVGVAIAGVAVVLGGLGMAIKSGHDESEALNRSFMLTGNAAGLTLGQVTALSQGLVASKGVTIGTAREITAALVDTGKFGGVALDSTAAAAASLGRVSGQSADEIVKGFAGITDGVTAWAVKSNASYRFLTAAQVEQIRNLEAQGRTDEAVKITMDALSASMDQRLAPSLGTLERGWISVKGAMSGFWDTLKDIGRDDTAEERLAKLKGRLDDLQQYQAKGGRKGWFGETIDSGDAGEVVSAQTEYDTAKGQANSDALRAADRAIAAKEEARKIEEGSRSYVDAVLAVERAGDAKRLASMQAGIDARQQAAAAGYARGETSASEYAGSLMAIERSRAAAAAEQIQQQISIEKRRVVESPKDVLAQQAAIAQLEAQAIAARTQAIVSTRELERGLAASQDGLDLARQQAQSDAAIRLIDASQTQIEQRQRAGLATAEQVADARLTIERAKLQQQAALIDAQIEQQKRLQVSGTAAIDRDTRVQGLENQRAGISAKIDAVPIAEGALKAERELNQSRENAKNWADAWVQANNQVIQLSEQNAQGRAALITDPVEQAKAQTAIQIAAIKRSADDLQGKLKLTLSLTTDEAQRALLEKQIDDVAAQTAESISIANDGLAERLKPGWKTMLDGWQDTNRLMRESSDEMLQGLVKGGEDAFVQFVKTGKLSVKSLIDDMLGQFAKLAYQQLLGQASSLFGGKAGAGGGVGSLLSGLGGLGNMFSQTSVKGYSGKEGDANFMGPPAALAGSLGGTDATTTATATATASAGLAATDKTATQAAGALGALAGVVGQNSEAGQALTAVQLGLQAAQMVGTTTQQVTTGTVANAMAQLFIATSALADAMWNAAAASSVSMGLAADGAIIPFATGGQFTNTVVSSPTMFLFANGTKFGLMGEAGPEAVMPLRKAGGGHAVDAIDSNGKPVGSLQLARAPGGRLSVVLGGGVQGKASGRSINAAAAGAAKFAAGGVFAFASGGAFAAARPGVTAALAASVSAPQPAAAGATAPGNAVVNQTINIGGGVSANDVSVAMARAKAEAVAAVADQMRRGNRSFSA
jgi:phage-related minor tail protein